MIPPKAISRRHISIHKIGIKLLMIKTLMRTLIASVMDGTDRTQLGLLAAVAAFVAGFLLAGLVVLGDVWGVLVGLGYDEFGLGLDVEFLLGHEGRAVL